MRLFDGVGAVWRRPREWAFERRVARMRRLPASTEAVLRVAAKLIRRARFEEADSLLEAAVAAPPVCARVLELYAMSAHQSQRHELALARWEAARRADDERPMPWVGIAANLRALGRTRAAEATIRKALDKFPADLVVAGEAARTFDRIGQAADAAEQWRRMLDVEPADVEYHQGYAYSLIELGHFEAAQTALDLAQTIHPDDGDLLTTRGLLEMAREDWNAALAIWSAYRARYPDNQAGWENQGKTIAAIHHARAEAGSHLDDVHKVDIEIVEDEATRALLLGFESIGADCEFGLVQRRFGAEPLGLLRFNDVRLPNLLAALDARFEGMGEEGNTELSVSDSGEFYVTDRRWQLGMHTFLFSSRHNAATLLPKMCRRVAYLRDKLLEDLQGATKTFVYKTNAIDLDGLLALHRRLQTFGPARLLHVRQASVPLADEPLPVGPGDVILLAPDLYVGFLGRMGNGGLHWDIAFEDWLGICTNLAEARLHPIQTAADVPGLT